MKQNSLNFWDNTQGVWEVISQSNDFFRAVETVLSFYDSWEDGTPNFNKDGTAFYVRKENYCIRVSPKWGQINTCNWTLDRDTYEQFVVARIYYHNLNLITDGSI